MGKEKDVIDFTDRFDKLLDKKPKKGSLKQWNNQWDALVKEFLGNEESETKSGGKKGKKEKEQGKNVGDIQGDLAGETTLQ